MKRKVFLSVLALFLMATSAAALPKVETPLIATTCGQSPGAMMIKMSAMQAKVAPVDASKTLTADELDPEKCKTLIVTTGTSMKGMGAAGTDVDKEIARCTALMKAAKEKGILVIGARIEGMARRTDASDEASIRAVMPWQMPSWSSPTATATGSSQNTRPNSARNSSSSRTPWRSAQS